MKISVRQLKQLIKEQLEEQMDEDASEQQMVKGALEDLVNKLGGPAAAKDIIMANLAQLGVLKAGKVDLASSMRPQAPAISPVNENRKRNVRK